MGQGRCGVGVHGGAVHVLRECAHPGVEQLHGGGAGEHLCAQEAARELGHPARQAIPHLGAAAHQSPGAQVVAAGAALDHVAGHGEGGAGEADQGRGAELRDGQAHRLADGLERGVVDVVQRRERRDVRLGADRMVEDGTHTGLDLHAEARQTRGDHDVGEEDPRVHPVAPHRLDGDLGDHLRALAGVEHRGALAQGAVLGQGAAGLSHEPHARGGAPHAAQLLQQGGIGHSALAGGALRGVLRRQRRGALRGVGQGDRRGGGEPRACGVPGI